MRYAALSLLLAACADPAIDVKLVMPPAGSAAFDLSCVSAVDVLPLAKGDTLPLDIGAHDGTAGPAPACIDLATAPTSFDDVEAQIRGKLDLPLPPGGLAGIEMRGRSGSCKDQPLHDSIFFGAAPYEQGQGSLVIPVKHNISCDWSATYTVRPVNLPQLVTSKTCAPVTTATVAAFDANLHPSELGGTFAPMVLEYGPSFAPLAMGSASINSYRQSYGGSCIVAAVSDEAGLGEFGATCLNPGLPTACAQPGEVEIPVIVGDYGVQSVDSSQPYDGAVLGAVWTKTPAAGPVTGATVTLDDGADATVVYTSVAMDKMTPIQGATATDATGGFIIYTNQVVGITVAAPGHPSQHLYVGSARDMPATVLPVLE